MTPDNESGRHPSNGELHGALVTSYVWKVTPERGPGWSIPTSW